MRTTTVYLPLALLVLMGCQPSDHYYWGHYEDLVYLSYADPGKVTPELEAQTLEGDIQQAAAANKPVPPGLHAHLGNLYFELGKADLARREFETEKQLFPESATLMDRMLAHLAKK